jgi:hypothetical protein
MAVDQRPSPFVPVLLAWLLPGAGHLKIGRLWPGVFTFAAILPLFVGGMALAGFQNVNPTTHPIYFWATHVFAGVLTGAATLLTRHVAAVRLTYQSTGDLFTAAAGLLNVIAIADVWSRCARGDPETRAAMAGPATSAPTADAETSHG